MCMAWIDYQKAFGMVHYSWLIGYLRIYGTAKYLAILFYNTLQHQKTTLTASEITLAEVNIRRGTFQANFTITNNAAHSIHVTSDSSLQKN